MSAENKLVYIPIGKYLVYMFKHETATQKTGLQFV